MMNKIDLLFQSLPIVSTMVDKNQMRVILNHLEKTNNIVGDVVELGCNIGTTSIFLQGYLGGEKKFHVYDSFEGFPEKDQKDEGCSYHFKFEKGACAIPETAFKETFKKASLPLPSVHKGWFKDISYLPEKISFAFFDSDFYTSILDSWEKVYPRLSKGAIVCIHDYNWDVLPGVKTACDEFLKDKQDGKILDYGNYIGVFTKQ
jgi:O-methyltransferase